MNKIYPPIYLDYAATTPCDPKVVDALAGWMKEQPAHPHADHPFALEKLEELSQAETVIKNYVNGDHVIWTSGATEANNIALLCPRCDHWHTNMFVTCKTEHKSILEPYKALPNRGIQVRQLRVDDQGHIQQEALEKILPQNPYMLSLMMINNETGVMHPIAEIGKRCRHQGILFHVDAAQAFGKVPIDMKALGVDLLTISSHKIYGPPGVGALVVTQRGLKRLNKRGIMFGGKPQHDIRPGTPPVALCKGFTYAAQLAYDHMQQEYDRLRKFKDYCWKTLQDNIPNVAMNGADDTPFILNIRIPFQENNPLEGLNEEIIFSTAAACNCGGKGHVTSAMGIFSPDFHILRLSFGRFTTQEQIEQAMACLIKRFESK